MESIIVICLVIIIPSIVLLIGNCFAIGIGSGISNFSDSIITKLFSENISDTSKNTELYDRQNELTKWNTRSQNDN
jgi:hypothetical protein